MLCINISYKVPAAKAKAAQHFPKFAEAMQYANVSVMGEIFYELKK